MSKFSDEYKSTFSQIRSDQWFEGEILPKVKPRRVKKRHTLVIAAAVCLIAALSVTAYAANVFSMRDLLLSPGSEPSALDLGWSGDDVQDTGVMPSVQLISLQGYSDSSEYKAAAEWLAFTESYDTDNAILYQVGNGPTGLDAKYKQYLVYSQEMADKLDEICAKYGLRLHREFFALYTKDEFISQAAAGNFLGGNHVLGGYMYDDGTFQFDSDATLSDGTRLSYQFRVCKKGVFDEVYLNIGNMSDYTEWSFASACGMTVSLSQSLYKSLIIAETDTSFVVINIMDGTADGVSSAALEAFADSFDFSLLY